MLERYGREVVAITTALVMGLGATACGSKSDSSSGSTSKHRHTQPHPSSPNVPNIQVRYFPNGSRELNVSNFDSSKFAGGSDEYCEDGEGCMDNLYEWCDGKDLVEEILFGQSLDDAAAQAQRLPNYPACADGRLTPSDFPATPSETVVH